MNSSTKLDLHKELQLSYKEFFESKMALAALKSEVEYPAVKKISNAILKLINSNEKIVIETIQSNPSITKELRVPYFGNCYDSKEEVTAIQVLEKIRLILADGKAELEKIMQIHCIFIYRIYDNLEKKPEKAELVSKIFPNSLFSKDVRSRIEKKEHDVKPTTQLGISRHSVFAKMIGRSDTQHLSAKDKFTPDYKSSFFKAAAERTIPIICGPSGHTGSLMLGAKLYGNLTAEELKEYALISFAFLAAGGNHSFHEVMVIAKLVGVDFQENDYSSIIPQSFKDTEGYKKLSQRFPEFLDSKPSLSF